MNEKLRQFARSIGLDPRILYLEIRDDPDFDARMYHFTYGKYSINRAISNLVFAQAINPQSIVEQELERALILLNDGINQKQGTHVDR